MGLIKFLGLSTRHEGQHVGGERGNHASKAGKHTKKAAKPKSTGKK